MDGAQVFITLGMCRRLEHKLEETKMQSEAKELEVNTEASGRVDLLVMPGCAGCAACGDDHYILNGCCNGYECSCMGQPVSMTNCPDCNPKGDKPIGEGMSYYAEHVEYIFKEA